MFRIAIFLFVIFSIVSNVFAQSQQPPEKSSAKETQAAPKKIRKVRRVAKPEFDDASDDVWFDSVFSDGLVGNRPKANVDSEAAAGSGVASTPKKKDDSTKVIDDGEFRWSDLISGTTIEDEVKAQNQFLAKKLTTPVRFKTEYNNVQQAMSLLSMSFAIVREYDAEIRWKDHAPAAHAALQQAAAKARSNSDQAFNYCNARKFDLEDLVRGGAFPETEKPESEIDWAEVIGRTETMIRLETADENLKLWTANKKTFEKQKAAIIAEAQWVAAIGAVIAKEGMDDADDEEYQAFCAAMTNAATATAQSAQNDDFDSTSRFANLVSQSCNKCHEQWR